MGTNNISTRRTHTDNTELGDVTSRALNSNYGRNITDRSISPCIPKASNNQPQTSNNFRGLRASKENVSLIEEKAQHPIISYKMKFEQLERKEIAPMAGEKFTDSEQENYDEEDEEGVRESLKSREEELSLGFPIPRERNTRVNGVQFGNDILNCSPKWDNMPNSKQNTLKYFQRGQVEHEEW